MTSIRFRTYALPIQLWILRQSDPPSVCNSIRRPPRAIVWTSGWFSLVGTSAQVPFSALTLLQLQLQTVRHSTA